MHLSSPCQLPINYRPTTQQLLVLLELFTSNHAAMDLIRTI
ncbi:MAG: hypothetical protein ACI9SB_001379, partial [Candidatus Azotimanducaceae bacterium]